MGFLLMVLESEVLKNWEGMSLGHRVSFGLGRGKWVDRHKR